MGKIEGNMSIFRKHRWEVLDKVITYLAILIMLSILSGGILYALNVTVLPSVLVTIISIVVLAAIGEVKISIDRTFRAEEEALQKGLHWTLIELSVMGNSPSTIDRRMGYERAIKKIQLEEEGL